MGTYTSDGSIVNKRRPMTMGRSLPDRYEGCVLGLVAGDALGADLEGCRSLDLLEAYARGSTVWVHGPLGRGTIDAALAVATAQSLVDCGGANGEDLARRYLALSRADGGEVDQSTWLAMRRLERGTPWHEAGDSGRYAAGAEPAARIAAVGLSRVHSREGLPGDVRASVSLTHRNSEAQAGALVVATAVACAASEGFRPTDLAHVLPALPLPPRGHSTICRVLEARHQAAHVAATLADLGAGPSAFEVVGTALYCCLAGQWEPERAVALAALMGGPAAARASIAGAIVGAAGGRGALPGAWTLQMANTQALTDIARGLLMLSRLRAPSGTQSPPVRTPA